MENKKIEEKFELLEQRDIEKICNLPKSTIRRLVFRGQIPAGWHEDERVLKLLESPSGEGKA